MPAVGQIAFERYRPFSILVFVIEPKPHLFTRRAMAGFLSGVECKFTGRYHRLYAFHCVTVAFSVFAFLVSELRVARAEAIIRNVGINLVVFQPGVVFFVGESCIGSHYDLIVYEVFSDACTVVVGLHRFDDRPQGMVLLAFSEGLSIDDDLVLFINRSNTVVALNRAFTCSHFRRLVIGDLAPSLGLLSLGTDQSSENAYLEYQWIVRPGLCAPCLWGAADPAFYVLSCSARSVF
ncbi:hypothetical protein BpHYR1_025658 [Brachionus plicatilis]|uniref:Uncharacterized protein n=1 Tax=Brachionus plicatilis TaxID=10195 RepID=A0A3M7QVH5_BRAPC|nr:hypothetical protein BpHYR1_025658 [Brachionus plicatilis]